MKLSFSINRIDSISQIDEAQISHENLQYMHGTGVAINLEDCRRTGEKRYKYRNGIQTKLGDIEETVWKELVKMLIKKENDEEFYKQILEYETEEKRFGVVDKDEIEKEALRAYAMKLYDKKSAWGYIRFNARYRPHLLEDPTLLTVIPDCCLRVCKATQERIEKKWDDPNEKVIPCPYCDKVTTFTIVD